jgi:tetratricopeptide (TPR) repeat protein
MGLFGFSGKPKSAEFKITEPDREWVEDNFLWLIKVYGYPHRTHDQMLISEQYFPSTFQGNEVKVENLLRDLAVLLNLDAGKITLTFSEDIRDTYGVPYEIEGQPFEAETELHKNGYSITVAKKLLSHPKRLICSIIYEFIKIRLTESKLEYDTGEDTSLFIYIAGIYFGFGVILTQNLTDIGRTDDGFWETKWSYISEMPAEVMVFGLATYAKLIENDNPVWKSELPRELGLLVEKAMAYLNEFPSRIFDKAELEANDLFSQADQEYNNQDYEAAISSLQKILFLTQDDQRKADAYNNMGYYLLRSGNIERGISYFTKALEIDPNYGFANDNLGYALIREGQLEEGRHFLEKALATGNNDRAYSFRNMAVYYAMKGEYELAGENFKKAFEAVTFPVDLLEFHYAEFLFRLGKKDEGMIFLHQAVEKGEHEAKQLLDEIKKN